jgi:hypothetical protein
MIDPDFKPPPWLGDTPHGDFFEYGAEADQAWFTDIPWEQRRGQSLHDAHVAALQGSPHNLELMRQFYANLVTRRLKQK